MAYQIVRRSLSTTTVAKMAQTPPIKLSASAGSHEGGMKLWRNLSFFIAVPGVLLCMLNAYLKEKEHMEHFHRPEFIQYSYLRIRNKKFPWGDGNHSLFHNKKVNPLPDGYED